MSLHGRFGALACALLLLPAPLTAQAADPEAPALLEAGAVADSYEKTHDEILGLRGIPDRVATVQGLVLERDVARFSLDQGSLQLLTPVGGRTVAAVFRGSGRFSFTPGSRIEQERLARFEKAAALEEPITELVLFFTDTTLAELERHLRFAPGPSAGDLQGSIKQALEHLGEKDGRSFEPDLMSAFLNGERSGFFYAWVRRRSGGPLMFMLNPNEFEAVRLSGRVTRNLWHRETDLITQFPRRGWVRPAGVIGERVRQAAIQRYTMDVRLPQTGIGEIGFSASAKRER